MKKELAIIKPIIVLMENKPQIAIAYENPKLRDYSEVERNTKVKGLVIFILNLLGVNEGKLAHTVAATNLISEIYLNHTIEEIKLAFKMFASGKFYEDGRPMFAAQQLNGLVIGKVMNAYDKDKKEKLVEYEKLRREQQMEENEKTPEQIERDIEKGLIDHYNHYLETGDLQGACDPIYWRLKRQGKFDWSEEQKELAKERATAYLTTEARLDGKNTAISGFAERLQEGSSVGIQARKVLLGFYYKSIS